MVTNPEICMHKNTQHKIRFGGVLERLKMSLINEVKYDKRKFYFSKVFYAEISDLCFQEKV